MLIALTRPYCHPAQPDHLGVQWWSTLGRPTAWAHIVDVNLTCTVYIYIYIHKEKPTNPLAGNPKWSWHVVHIGHICSHVFSIPGLVSTIVSHIPSFQPVISCIHFLYQFLWQLLLLAIPKALELAAVALHPPATEEALGSSGPPPTYSLRILVPPLLLTYPWVIFYKWLW